MRSLPWFNPQITRITLRGRLSILSRNDLGAKSTMHGVIALSIIFGGSILILAIIGSTILMAMKFFKGPVSKRGQQNQTDEAKMIQEIYKGLSLMEERLEALETIILDRERKDRAL
jgi:hypothetical protein